MRGSIDVLPNISSMQAIDLVNPYAWLMCVRRRLYRRRILHPYKVTVPVVAVGNLTTGGTGKTPLTQIIARYYQDDLGLKVAVVLRGYGRKTRGQRLVSEGNGPLISVAESGDEAYLLAESLPGVIVVVDENRVRGSEHAIALGANIIILDDAFQHLRIHRDLNILSFDVDRGFHPVLPFGRARETPSAAADADVLVMMNGSDDVRSREFTRILSIGAGVSLPTARVRQRAVGLGNIDRAINETEGLSVLRGSRVLALSSIASPERFHRLLQLSGAEVIPMDLGDHAAYTPAIVSKALIRAKQERCDLIVTTTKDIVKSRPYFLSSQPSIPVYTLLYDLEFLSGRTTFFDQLQRIGTNDASTQPVDIHPDEANHRP